MNVSQASCVEWVGDHIAAEAHRQYYNAVTVNDEVVCTVAVLLNYFVSSELPITHSVGQKKTDLLWSSNSPIWSMLGAW